MRCGQNLPCHRQFLSTPHSTPILALFKNDDEDDERGSKVKGGAQKGKEPHKERQWNASPNFLIALCIKLPGWDTRELQGLLAIAQSKMDARTPLFYLVKRATGLSASSLELLMNFLQCFTPHGQAAPLICRQANVAGPSQSPTT